MAKGVPGEKFKFINVFFNGKERELKHLSCEMPKIYLEQIGRRNSV